MSEQLENLIRDIDLKFSSLNSVPVKRAPVTREEWDQIRPVLVEATQRHRGTQ